MKNPSSRLIVVLLLLTVAPAAAQTAISADGLIESTVGGFKFPDGTIQASAGTIPPTGPPTHHGVSVFDFVHMSFAGIADETDDPYCTNLGTGATFMSEKGPVHISDYVVPAGKFLIITDIQLVVRQLGDSPADGIGQPFNIWTAPPGIDPSDPGKEVVTSPFATMLNYQGGVAGINHAETTGFIIPPGHVAYPFFNGVEGGGTFQVICLVKLRGYLTSMPS
jgi:hypothetical protein